MKYLYISLLHLCSSNFNLENIEQGLIKEENSVLVLRKDMNDEILHLTIEYPFQPLVYNKSSNLGEPSKCKNLLNQFTESRIQNSINLYFEEGRKFLETPHRQKRQALLISAAAGILGYFTHSLVDSFTSITHTVNTEKYMDTKIQNLLCSDLNLQHKILEIKEELRGDEITNLYFKTIEYDTNKFNEGNVHQTQAEELFRNICQTLNEKNVCDYLIEFGTKNIELIGNGFIQNDLYQIQVRLCIPRLTGIQGQYIKLHKVPLPSEKWYQNIVLDTTVVSYQNKTISSKHCTGNQKVQICDFTQELSLLQFPNLWSHETIYVENLCIPIVFQEFIVLSAKVSASIQYLSQEIETKQLTEGIHVYNRPNKVDILITCNKETYKILYSRFQDKNFSKIVDTEHINLTFTTNIESSQVIDYSDHSHMKTTIILAFFVLLNAVTIFFSWCRIQRKIVVKPIPNTKWENESLKSIKI